MSLVRPAVEEARQAGEQHPGRRTGASLLVLAGYLLAAVAVTGRLWLDPASRAQAGDIRDVDQFTWFVRSSATAIAHFHLPALMTQAMDPPHGVNLMWNTSFLLPGVLLSPVTLLAGPQASLNVALAASFALSAASLFWVLRRWQVSLSAAALAGAVYGFSPALVNSGQGHYHMVFAALPPLIIDAGLRIVTGRGRPVRTGLWLGVLIAAQLFTGEEMLIDTAITAVVLGVVLVACAPRLVAGRLRGAALGLGTGALAALVLSARGLWVQFHGAVMRGGGATTVIQYNGHLTHIYTIPYAFVTPSDALLVHTGASAAAAAAYPQPQAEYLAYLGVPLILVLIAAAIWCWRNLAVRACALTVAILELFSLGGQPVTVHGMHYPAALLPWYWLQDLPGISSALPDRLSILADGLAAAVLAFSLDLARSRARARAASQREGDGGDQPPPRPVRRLASLAWTGGRWASVVAVAAVLPLIPLPYHVTGVSPVPAGWRAAFSKLALAPDARVLVVPVPWGGIPQPLRWQAVTAEPGSLIGGAFIQPGLPGRQSRAGRAGQTVTTRYLDALWQGKPPPPAPTSAQLRADLARWQPAAVIAVTGPASPLGRYLTGVFGPPQVRAGRVLGWRLQGTGQPPAASAASVGLATYHRRKAASGAVAGPAQGLAGAGHS
ncbi:MAG TPA: hypothetical protein VH637_21100 [Streptosporangiaceae bacterium]